MLWCWGWKWNPPVLFRAVSGQGSTTSLCVLVWECVILRAEIGGVERETSKQASKQLSIRRNESDV